MSARNRALGTALLSTIAASATSSFIAANASGRPSAAIVDRGSIHGYTTAFWVSAAIFLAGAVISARLHESGARVTEESTGESAGDDRGAESDAEAVREPALTA